MTDRVPHRDDPTHARPSAPLGLRLRLWLACLAGGIVAGLGSLWVLGTKVRPGATDEGALLAWLSAAAGLAVVAGAAAALWLDHHLVGHLRGLLRGLETGRVSELRGLPGASGWGEVSDLTDSLQTTLTRLRHSARAAEDLDQLRRQLEAVRASLDTWIQSERWEPPSVGAAPGAWSGPVADVAEALGRGLARQASVEERNREAARQVARELSASLGDSQEAAEQAERGFVESTALLTTIRELQRLSLELQNALAAPGPSPAEADEADDAFRRGTRAALEELIEASNDSVQSISRGLMRVQDIAEQVQLLGNRSTLIAIHAVMSGARDAGRGDDVTEELKQLARDVREATDRTSQFTQEIEREVTTAGNRMREVRARTLERLERLLEPAADRPSGGVPADRRGSEDAQRLLERVREMVQDAARKGERLSAAGERCSRAAERLARRLEDEARESEALVVRLAPVGDADHPSGGAPAVASAANDESPPGLRVIEPPAPDLDVEPGEERGAGEEHP